MKTYRIQEIVFAELDGFMEEKMKNYSSGMRSRLAFAIATAGDAADILLLDEVLSPDGWYSQGGVCSLS